MGYYVKNRRLQSGSTGVRLPVGSALDRPEYPTFGMIRYNTDSASVEFYDGSIWAALSAAGAISYTVDSFNADGSTTVFVMSIAEASATQIIVFIGSIYQDPSSPAYSVDGGLNITFTSAPPDGTVINVIHSET
jgi:hypothetical protein